MADASTPFFPSTSTEHAAWIVAITVTFLIYAIIGVTAKLAYRLRDVALKSYDWFVVVSLLVAFAQSVIVIRACINGLGKHEIAHSDSVLETVSKELFTASLLSVIVHTLAKISVTLFVIAINAKRELKLACYALLVVIGAWGISSIFLLGFRCGSSAPWFGDQDQCLEESRVYLGINMGNIITDIALVVLPIVMLWDIQTNLKVKAGIMALFASRIVVPAMVATQTGYLRGSPSTENDVTWNLVDPTILAQVAMSLSILTACIPSLKGVIEMFCSGASQFIVPTVYTSSHNNSGNHGLQSLVPKRFRTNKSESQTHPDQTQLRSGVVKESHTRSRERSGHPYTNLQHSESQINLRDNHIIQTTEYEVSYEPAKDPTRKAESDGVSQQSTDVYGQAYGPRVL